MQINNKMYPSRVAALPNILTYTRVAIVPMVVACFFFKGDGSRWLAMSLFALAAITDFFDGYLARNWNMQSSLGQMLDPIADKLLVSASILVLTMDGTISGFSVWAALIILCREILVSGLREFLAELNVGIPVTYLAKWKTVVQMIALGFLLLGPAGDVVIPFITILGLAMLWASAILTLYTGYDYFRAGLRHVI